MNEEKFVVITTSHRGVFAGVLDDQTDKVVTLKNARMCVYWSADVRGVVGLAKGGPTASCKITPAAMSVNIPSETVTLIMDATDPARKAWENEPWG